MSGAGELDAPAAPPRPSQPAACPAPPDFVAVGHVARDLMAGGWRLGGAVSYASFVAARLGLRAALVTAASDALDLATTLPGVAIYRAVSEHTTALEHHFESGRRRLFVRTRARPLQLADVPPEVRQARAVLLAPLIGELDSGFARAFPAAVVGAAAQGWLRRAAPDGFIEEGHIVAFDPARSAEALGLLFLSQDDLGGAPLPPAWLASVPVISVTRGAAGAEIYSDGAVWHMPAFPAREVDATGAGDAFAAAFLLHYARHGSPAEAARFAACVASFVVEAPGISGAPGLCQVEQRLRNHPDLVLTAV